MENITKMFTYVIFTILNQLIIKSKYKQKLTVSQTTQVVNTKSVNLKKTHCPVKLPQDFSLQYPHNHNNYAGLMVYLDLTTMDEVNPSVESLLHILVDQD